MVARAGGLVWMTPVSEWLIWGSLCIFTRAHVRIVSSVFSGLVSFVFTGIAGIVSYVSITSRVSLILIARAFSCSL